MSIDCCLGVCSGLYHCCKKALRRSLVMRMHWAAFLLLRGCSYKQAEHSASSLTWPASIMASGWILLASNSPWLAVRFCWKIFAFGLVKPCRMWHKWGVTIECLSFQLLSAEGTSRKVTVRMPSGQSCHNLVGRGTTWSRSGSKLSRNLHWWGSEWIKLFVAILAHTECFVCQVRSPWIHSLALHWQRWQLNALLCLFSSSAMPIHCIQFMSRKC